MDADRVYDLVRAAIMAAKDAGFIIAPGGSFRKLANGKACCAIGAVVVDQWDPRGVGDFRPAAERLGISYGQAWDIANGFDAPALANFSVATSHELIGARLRKEFVDDAG
jgi:hypothetical protein